jgi:hypothetical protein
MKNRNENTTIPHISYTTMRLFLKNSLLTFKVLLIKKPMLGGMGFLRYRELYKFSMTKDPVRN